MPLCTDKAASIPPFDEKTMKTMDYLANFFIGEMTVPVEDLVTSFEHKLGCLRTLNTPLLTEIAENAKKVGWITGKAIMVLSTLKEGIFKVPMLILIRFITQLLTNERYVARRGDTWSLMGTTAYELFRGICSRAW